MLGCPTYGNVGDTPIQTGYKRALHWGFALGLHTGNEVPLLLGGAPSELPKFRACDLFIREKKTTNVLHDPHVPLNRQVLQ